VYKMDYTHLEQYSYADLKQLAMDMDLTIRRSKAGMIEEISNAFREYEKYKKDKKDRYKRLEQLGDRGKEGTTYLVKTRKGKMYAMKTFRKQKSSNTLCKEADLQKMAADVGAAPNVVDIDTVSKYIVMERMDRHLLQVVQEQGNRLTKDQQKQIISIYKKLDQANVFHGDANLMNYMYKGDRLYIIDFGMAKEITTSLKRELGTDTPNVTIMTLGMVLKLREKEFPASSYRYLVRYLTPEMRTQFGFATK